MACVLALLLGLATMVSAKAEEAATHSAPFLDEHHGAPPSPPLLMTVGATTTQSPPATKLRAHAGPVTNRRLL